MVQIDLARCFLWRNKWFRRCDHLVPTKIRTDPRLVGMTGITGWIIPLVIIGIIYMTKRYPKNNEEI